MWWNKRSSSLFDDEVVSDALGSDCGSLEEPVNHVIFSLVYVSIVIVAVILIGRLFYLNVVRGAFYEERSLSNVNHEIKTPAPRGLIVDRFGESLVENLPTFSVVLNVSDFLRYPDKQSTILASLSDLLGLDPTKIRDDLLAVDLERNNDLVIAKDISLDKAVTLKSQKLSSVFVVDDYRRQYLYPNIFSHILGYTSEVTRDELNTNSSLDLGDDIGRNGIESYYDGHLRGEKGRLVDLKDVRGETIDQRKLNNPVAGDTLELTVDAELQEFFYRRMNNALYNLGRTNGVALALNPQTGEILAALSFPSYDNNAFVDESRSGERLNLLSDPNHPLFNRFVSGLYNPGSTIKPLVALAALAEKVVTTADIFFSKGYIELANPYNPDQPSRFVDWKPHGWVDLYSALARSSNVYFYYVGGGFADTKGLGIARLNKWWRQFNLDKITGVDLPGEKSGFLPNADEKEERTGTPWRVGDTYNVSIGQGDLAITPLELLNYISAIANGGTFYEPYLVKNFHPAPKIISTLSGVEGEILEVQKGMRDAITKSYGTGYILHDLPIEVAGKTGSAQVLDNTKTNAFFVGYAPFDHPKIAVLVLVEDAKEGSLNTVPVAKEIFYWYYYNRLQKSPSIN